MKLAEKVVYFLKEKPGSRFKAREIAEWIWENHPDDCKRKMAASKANNPPIKDKRGFLNQLVAEISSIHKNIIAKEPNIRTTEGRPRQYYYSTQSSAEPENSTSIHPQSGENESNQRNEHDLYPLLSKYLKAEHEVNSKRINEKKSTNKKGPGGNEWLFPDLVGLEDLSRDWDDGIKECVGEYGDKKARLWSFEVKLQLDMSNVRRSFFQAASNSSWANYGYLVAGEITGKDTMQELKMLCALHGIGFIRLDTETPENSEVTILAGEKEVDWNSANRLAAENTDFSEFIQLVTSFHKDGTIHNYQWDAKLENGEG